MLGKTGKVIISVIQAHDPWFRWVDPSQRCWRNNVKTICEASKAVLSVEGVVRGQGVVHFGRVVMGRVIEPFRNAVGTDKIVVRVVTAPERLSSGHYHAARHSDTLAARGKPEASPRVLERVKKGGWLLVLDQSQEQL